MTDGQNVWALTGTGILKAFDFEGKELWARDIQADYGAFGLQWGYGSSPLLHGDSLYVQVLHGMRTNDPSYVLRVSKANGRTIWRVERPTQARFESPDAYTTPALLRYGKAPKSSSRAATWSLVMTPRTARNCGGPMVSILRTMVRTASSHRRLFTGR